MCYVPFTLVLRDLIGLDPGDIKRAVSKTDESLYTVNRDIFAGIHFHGFDKMGNFAKI